MFSKQADQAAAEVLEREEVLGELLVAHGDPAQVLDLLEEALDQVPLFVQVAVDRTLHRARSDATGCDGMTGWQRLDRSLPSSGPAS